MLHRPFSQITTDLIGSIEPDTRDLMRVTIEHLSRAFLRPLYGDDGDQITDTVQAIYYQTLRDEIFRAVPVIAERKRVSSSELEDLAIRKLENNTTWRQRVWDGRNRQPLIFTRRMIEYLVKDTADARERRKLRKDIGLLPKAKPKSEAFWLSLDSDAELPARDDFRRATVDAGETDDQILSRYITPRTFEHSRLSARQRRFLAATVRIATSEPGMTATAIIDRLRSEGKTNARQRFYELRQLINTRERSTDSPDTHADLIERIRHGKHT